MQAVASRGSFIATRMSFDPYNRRTARRMHYAGPRLLAGYPYRGSNAYILDLNDGNAGAPRLDVWDAIQQAAQLSPAEVITAMLRATGAASLEQLNRLAVMEVHGVRPNSVRLIVLSQDAMMRLGVELSVARAAIV